MSTPHRATPDQWNYLIEALEAVQQQVSELQTMHNTATDWQMEQDARLRALKSPQQPTVKESFAPADSLVERVAACVEYGIDANQDPEGIARAAIRAMAAWLKNERESPFTVDLLVQEAER